MKKLVLITGLCVCCAAYAEPRTLPPIINNSTYANGTSYTGGGSSNKTMLEMLGRVESLQNEIQQLRGLVEQQTYEINNLKKRQQNIYSDIDVRLQQLETVGGIENNRSEKENTFAPVAEKPVTTSQKPAQTPKSKAREKVAFDKAFASVKNSQYQQAIKLLKQFLIDYPVGEYSDNATFWLASVYKVVNDIPAAKTNFQAVYTEFPESEKAGMAMLKLADIYFEESDKLKAEQLYTQVTQQYAGTTAEHMAVKKLQSLGR